MSSNEILFFFSALGAFNGFLLSLYFGINAGKKIFTNYFLSLLLLVLSIRVIKSVFFYFNPDLSGVFIQIGLSACLLIGPFLFLFLKSSTCDEKPGWAKHVIPYLLVMTIAGVLFPYVEHRIIWSRWVVKVIYFQWGVYNIFSLKYIFPIVRKFKEKRGLRKLDLWFISIYAGVVIIWLAYTFAAYTSYIVGALSFTFILFLIALLLIFRNSSDTSFFQEKEKYKNKEIDKDTLEQIGQKISIIVEKELFLNPDFNLEEAARQLKVTKHLLSQYVNEILGKSFSNLIKEFRIEKAKELLETEKNYTIESLGYDSGFTSKSTFFTAFKKATGLTPAEYQKMHSK